MCPTQLELSYSCNLIANMMAHGGALQDKARLEINRLQRLSSGFGNFTTSGIRSAQPVASAPALDDTSREILRMVFDRNGSYLQVMAYLGLTSIYERHGPEKAWPYPQLLCTNCLTDSVQSLL